MDSAFYFDLASPPAYLAAERILQALPGPVEWQPVLARELPRSETFDVFRCEAELDVFRGEIERGARLLGLQPLRWPEPFPFDSELAMRAATYAKGIGRVVPFAQAAFRQAFAGGHDLERTEFVLIAAAACEMHPRAVVRGTRLSSVHAQLMAATARAAAAGVGDVPAVRIGKRVFAGPRALEEAIRHVDLAREPPADEEGRALGPSTEAAQARGRSTEAAQAPGSSTGVARAPGAGPR